MRVFIAGATGVLGRSLVRQFSERGHTVYGLTRDERGEKLVRSLGGESRKASLFDADELAHAADGAEVVIHAATSIPNKRRLKPADFAENDRIRRDGTRSLGLAASRIGARLYLQQSIVWVARPPDGAPFDEDTTPQPDEISRSAYDAEQIAAEAGAVGGFGVGILRCGWFYAPDAASTRMFGEGLKRRRMPIVGSGDAVLACLHVEDAASAFVAAAETGRSGLWHAVDDQPVTVKELLTTFASMLGAPPPMRVPVWLARLAAGSYAAKFLTSSTRTTNKRMRRETNWTPRFPSYREGLEQIIAEWGAASLNNQRSPAAAAKS
jgi:nucleoside-diphosphate-sugar epimerase